MKRKETTDRILTLAISFVFFVCGVFALHLGRGPVRSGALTLCFAALIAIAVRQTVRRMKKGGE